LCLQKVNQDLNKKKINDQPPLITQSRATCAQETYFIINFFVLLKGHLHFGARGKLSVSAAIKKLQAIHINGVFFPRSSAYL
jgi:hypothetical protein